jgi:molybdenum cofactor guanylyltransferase
VPKDITALILAGGKGTRMGGIAKHEIVIEGEPIWKRQLAVLVPRVDEVIFSGAKISGFRTVLDTQAGQGPLSGIAAGLAAIAAGWLIVVAGDMPYITGALIDSLVAARHDNVDAVAIDVDGRLEPLCCILHARARPEVDRRLAAGLLRASSLFEGARVRWITDADPAALRNLNSPSDLPR